MSTDIDAVPVAHPLSIEPLTGTARLTVEVVLSLAETMAALPLDEARQAVAAERAKLRGGRRDGADYDWLALAASALGMASQLAACAGTGELQAHSPFGAQDEDAPVADPVPDDGA